MRGAFTRTASSRTSARAAVVTPYASISRASNPTDRVQAGQAGTSTLRLKLFCSILGLMM